MPERLRFALLIFCLWFSGVGFTILLAIGLMKLFDWWDARQFAKRMHLPPTWRPTTFGDE